MRSLQVDDRKELLALAKIAKPRYYQKEIFVVFHGWYDDVENIYLDMEYLGKMLRAVWVEYVKSLSQKSG